MARRTKAEWLSLFQQQRDSGLSIKDFCQQHQLNPGYFSKRRGELESRTDVASPFVRITGNSPTEPVSSRLLIRVGQAELQLPVNISPQWVAQLLRAM